MVMSPPYLRGACHIAASVLRPDEVDDTRIVAMCAVAA
jgi:hypothetical protein